jgi:hypothetical protein
MRRRSVAVVVVGVCLILAGCKGAAEETKAPEKPAAVAERVLSPIPDPNCTARDVTTCPPMLAMVSTGAPMVLEEYGISARFPAESRVCYGLSGPHAHGFYTRLGDQRAACWPSRDFPHASAISIWGDGNSAFYKTLEEARGEDCRTTGVGNHLTAPDGRPFRLKRLASRVCERAEANGGFSIEVTAMAGRWGGSDEDADTPYVIYRAGLTTTPDRLAADKVVFQRFLDGLVLTPPHPFDPEVDCQWTRGVLYAANGTPSWRIRLATGRVLGVSSSQGPEGPHVLPDNARQAFEAGDNGDTTEVAGEWQVCPFAADRPGWMRPVFLTGARKLTTGHR